MNCLNATKTPPTFLARWFGVCLVLSGLVAPTFGQPVDQSLYSAMVWRNVGPFRGGRVSAVSAPVGQPGVCYMGLPLGGVWKTTSAGVTWFPIMDSVKEDVCVGAIEVAPSDPNIVYVGMGDLITGGGINEGNGVYKSTDAGKTWQHLELEGTKQIPAILVDPKDPNLVFVAAQGNIRQKSETRGLFRSTDGGKTWAKTLYVDDQTGVQDIAWAFDNPKVMLATTVRHFAAPGAPRGGGGGQQQGPSGTELFKSTDQGLTWTKLTGGGLPSLSGRTSVAVAMNTNSQRMFIVQNSGLWRSDDGGTSWRQMDPTDRRVANGQGGYNCGVYVNTKNPDIVYVVNTCSYISKDGGETFTGFKGAPGGDDPQQFWFDPTDSNRILLGADQGATVSLDGGNTWSSWYNQPTAQVYHISTDNQFPYWIYATQQDSCSIGTVSRGNLGAITPLDWLPHPGYEFGSIVADPMNPKISYAGGPGGGIIKATYPSGQWIDVSPSVDRSAGLRKVGNQPLAFNPANPRELFAGFQCLMSTTDGGKNWKKLSPDLGYPKGVTPPKPGETPARPGGGTEMRDEILISFGDDEEQEMLLQQAQAPGGSIQSFSVSTIDGKTIWVGTNNGLIKVTKDHGATWEDVTIPGLTNPTRADISAIDASHHELGTAYVAIDYHNTGDYTPHFYRTHDYGKTWTRIVSGLATNQPNGSFARVIRADTKKQGLLFAGTESSMYVSFNDGDDWQSLMMNLPCTSYRDATIHENDLVVGTYGRSFWILDDISPLRQIAASQSTEPVVLFKPGDAYRVRRNVNGDTPMAPELPHAVNPPVGALIYYYLGSEPKGLVTLEIADSAGKVVRHLSSAPLPVYNEPPPPVPDYWLERPEPMPTKTGMSRISWNLRYDSPSAFSHSYEINANFGETPLSPEGPLALPGVYTLTLTVDGRTYKQTVTVKNDPRSPATFADLRAQHELQMKLYECAAEAWEAYQEVASMRASVAEIVKAAPAPEVTTAANAFDAKLALVGGTGGGGRRGFGGGGGQGGPPPAPTFATVQSTMIRQLSTLDSGDMAPNDSLNKAGAAICADYKTALNNWKALNTTDLVAFNALLGKHNLKPIATATSLGLSTTSSGTGSTNSAGGSKGR